MNNRLVFFTGAGISAESGIPTFQSQPGIREKLERDYAITHYEDYIANILYMKEACDAAVPNAAHYAIAKINAPVITMNIDGLHEKAGSKKVLAIHGRLPTHKEIKTEDLRYKLNVPVLYGDPAPLYQDAINLMYELKYKDSYVVIVGTSFYTGISERIYEIAKQRAKEVWLINENAKERVPALCEILQKLLLI